MISKSILQTIIQDQKEHFGLPNHLIQRDVLYRINNHLDDPNIIILSGVRRCGKSTLLHQLRQQLPQSNYFLNFDDERLAAFTVDDFQILYESFIELYGQEQVYYFDEIQNIPGWERFVRRLHDYGHKVYVTGSNASMLSKELGTRLTGRYIAIDVYPLSFKETLTHTTDASVFQKNVLSTHEKIALKKAFIDYMQLGGFPEYRKFKKLDYLQTLLRSILYRDVLVRHHLTNDIAMRELVHYCASNIGKEISYHKLAQLLGIKNGTTIKDYLSHLNDAYLCFALPQYHHSLKAQLKNPKKIYMIDHALALASGFRTSCDDGRVLENIVYIELLRRQHDVFSFKDRFECDFIIRTSRHITTALQVTLSLSNKTTRQREINGLIHACNHHPITHATIITLDEHDHISIDVSGRSIDIQIIPIYQWLLSNG